MTDTALLASLDDAGETIADLRTALLNAETERDCAQAEAAALADTCTCRAAWDARHPR